ncbi:MAG: hypothetical protein Q8J68_11575 [Methanolobus sp.]|uniref:hypothetical protein n=1 Tax=Methanolobus sp. TaxID=1874737 RepID=UPI002731BD90|nr:hypothetical protein [Methanolobus sp.]MDP2217911.1 hypothetical protein [Methanolobus sp.]
MTVLFIKSDLAVSHVTINCRPTSAAKVIMPSISATLPAIRRVAKADPMVLRRNTSEMYPQNAKTIILSIFSQLLKKILMNTGPPESHWKCHDVSTLTP